MVSGNHCRVKPTHLTNRTTGNKKREEKLAFLSVEKSGTDTPAPVHHAPPCHGVRNLALPRTGSVPSKRSSSAGWDERHPTKERGRDSAMPVNHLKFFRNPLAMSALILLLLTGCGVTLQSVERDKEVGRATARQVEADMGLYQDQGKAEYLNRVGGRLVTAHSDPRFTYQFSVVDPYQPNAFAVPGGYVYVSRGLLVLTNSEDELANVLAHEIIHVSRRHSAKQIDQGGGPAAPCPAGSHRGRRGPSRPGSAPDGAARRSWAGPIWHRTAGRTSSSRINWASGWLPRPDMTRLPWRPFWRGWKPSQRRTPAGSVSPAFSTPTPAHRTGWPGFSRMRRRSSGSARAVWL